MRPYVLAAGAVAMLSGCSFALVRPSPTPATATTPASCETKGWPVIDLVGGLGAMTFGTARLSECLFSCSEDDSDDARRTGTVLIAASLGMFASAVYGFVASSTCNRRLDALSAPSAPTTPP